MRVKIRRKRRRVFLHMTSLRPSEFKEEKKRQVIVSRRLFNDLIVNARECVTSNSRRQLVIRHTKTLSRDGVI